MIELPLTSIIIPIHNCLELTRECLCSVRKYTQAPYELILIDDASDDETADYLRSLQSDTVKLIRNENRKCYAENNNAGAVIAEGKYLCLLNNDTLVTEKWLTNLVACLENEPDIGVLGNKHLFPDSKLLHHCGMAYDKNGAPWHLYPYTSPNVPAVNEMRDLQCVTFACVLIPSSVYQQLKGLDEAYKNGYEDCDFCLRARVAGFRVTYMPKSTIYHYGQSTPGRTAHDDANEQLFKSRWADEIQPDLESIVEQDKKLYPPPKRHPGFLQRALRFISS